MIDYVNSYDALHPQKKKGRHCVIQSEKVNFRQEDPQ